MSALLTPRRPRRGRRGRPTGPGGQSALFGAGSAPTALAGSAPVHADAAVAAPAPGALGASAPAIPAPARVAAPAPVAAPARVAAPAPDAPPTASAHCNGPTLDDLVAGAWEGLVAGAAADCLVCGAALAPRHSAGAGIVGGRCGGCGTTMS